jgi:hypothetical protein
MAVSMKAAGSRTYVTEKHLSATPTATATTDTSRWAKLMVKVSILGPTVKSSMESGLWVSSKVTESGEVCITILILGNGLSQRLMDMVFTLGRTETATKVNGIWPSSTEQELIFSLLETHTLENIKTASPTVKVSTRGAMGHSMSATLKTA